VQTADGQCFTIEDDQQNQTTKCTVSQLLSRFEVQSARCDSESSPARRPRIRLNRRPRICQHQSRGLTPSPVKERFKAIIELISVASSVFAIHRETVAELEKLDPSPEQQAILARFKGSLAKHKAEFKEGVKDGFGAIARIRR
jgi:hypothetical protein